MDGASGPLSKISSTSDKATDKILKASGATDTFNKKLDATGASANKASSGTSKLVTKLISLAALLKGITIVDGYTNTSARLGLITDSLEEQKKLQEQIFASANRSRGIYSDMASAVAKLGITASEAFGSNDELVAFTELIQKGFKVGGASQSEQSAAMLQLTQAMGSGKLQGDEFRSIMENAPMIADAIAKYVNISKGELKELASEGEITSDIIKNAIFAASDGINEKFESMPMTFSEVWSKIKNAGTQAFGGMMENISTMLNSTGIINAINVIIGAIYLLADTINFVVGLISDYWPVIQAILIGIGALILINIIGYLSAVIPVLISIISLWFSMNLPMIAMIGAIAAIVYAFGKLGITAEDVFGFIGGVVGVAVAMISNLFLGLLELVLGVINFLVTPFVNFANFIGNIFTSPISSVIYMFQGMADSILATIQKVASAMDFVFGSNMADTVAGWRSGLKEMADNAVAEYAPNEDYQKVMNEFDMSASDFGFERVDENEAWEKGTQVGKNVYSAAGDKLSDIADSLTNKGGNTGAIDTSGFGSASDPLTVKGKGKNDKVDVNMSDEDMQYLRDIAERDYINKFSTNTLAPNVTISFGDVHETADANKVAGRIKKILQEEIALTAEGAY